MLHICLSDKAVLSKVCWAISTRTTGTLPGFRRNPKMCNVVSTTSRNMSHDSGNNKQSRPDPFARRPNQKCDPYGQGGKPLTAHQAEQLLPTVHSDWVLQGVGYQDRRHQQHDHSSTNKELSNNNNNNNETTAATMMNTEDAIPTLLRRTFVHPDFMAGASFLNHMAAVAQMNDHYPSLSLERQLDSRRKQWTVISTITCHTFVLQGLSHHDFFLATMVDVEIDRPEIKQLLLLE